MRCSEKRKGFFAALLTVFLCAGLVLLVVRIVADDEEVSTTEFNPDQQRSLLVEVNPIKDDWFIASPVPVKPKKTVPFAHMQRQSNGNPDHVPEQGHLRRFKTIEGRPVDEMFPNRKKDMPPSAYTTSIPDGYVPIVMNDVSSNNIPSVDFCAVPFKTHHESKRDMMDFNDIATLYCNHKRIKSFSFTDLARQYVFKSLTGVVFTEPHDSQLMVGSMLAADPDAMVYVDPRTVLKILSSCQGCNNERKVYLLRAVVNSMTNSANHTRTYLVLSLKFAKYIDVLLQAFPITPWVYIYRNPAENIASYHGTPYCHHLLDDKNPQTIGKLLSWTTQPNDDMRCGAYLHTVESHAYAAASNLNSWGLLMLYDTIPAKFPSHVVPFHFNQTISDAVKTRMSEILSRFLDKGWINQFMMDLFHDMLSLPVDYDRLREKNDYHKWQVPQADASKSDLSNIPERERDIKEFFPFPELRPLGEILREWPPDEPNVPDIPGIYEGSLPRFNYMNETERKMALLHRQHETPFVTYNHPEINGVVDKWTQSYLKRQFGDTPMKVTYSRTNHFMYYNRQGIKENPEYYPGMETAKMTYENFLHRAEASMTQKKIDVEHFYLQLADHEKHTRWIGKDIPSFGPQPGFFINEASQNRGINCRFGTRGVIAEMHWDGGRNFIAMLKGNKRYVLLPPSECKRTYLHPNGHPEGRHAKADWSDLDYSMYPLMNDALATQVVLRPGEVLYLPSYWFHYIISLNVSIQCNTRSGLSEREKPYLADCGFP